MIDSYSFGKIEIEGQKYTNDIIILPDKIIENWWRKEGHRLHLDDIEEIIEANPDVLIIGTGANGRMTITTQAKEHIKSKKIDLIVEKTDEACKKYNELVNKKKVAAALHLTC